jgi:CDP-4-dehydro-6-deoxyglucose reductase, E3
VKPGETILNAAEREGYLLFKHQSTFCNHCKAQLLEGEVSYRNDHLSLSEDERETGFTLMCEARPESDLLLHFEDIQFSKQTPTKKLIYDVESIELLTGDVYRVMVQPPANDYIDYQAGQYVEILHRDVSPRPFSIANTPAEDHHIELHIRYLPDNPYTIELLEEIKSKHKLLLNGPIGNSVYRNDPFYPIIVVAGGTGFAPAKALLETALLETQIRPIYLFWGARTFHDLYLHTLPLELSKRFSHFHYIPVLSASLSRDKWRGKTGLVHETVLKEHSDLSDHYVYASGPPEMAYAAQRAFLTHGLNKSLMYSDWFDYEAK